MGGINGRLTLKNSMGGSTLAIEKRAGWASGKKPGVDHSRVVDLKPILARDLTVSKGPSVWRGSES